MGTAQQIIAANELAWQHWRTAARNSPVAAWLQGRGLDPAEVARAGWTPGWAADDWRDLTHLLARHGVPTQVGLDAGLLRRAESGRMYDGFRGRVVLPVRGLLDGGIYGFTARRRTDRDDDVPKYINSPTNAAYRKGQALFGAWEARQALRASRDSIQTLVVCEGPFDVVRIAMAGSYAPVAPCGTAMTADQANWIVALGRGYNLPIMLAYDGDPAGEAAMWRAWDLLRASGARDLCLSDVPDGRDPADLCPEDLATALSLPSRRISGFTAGLGG